MKIKPFKRIEQRWKRWTILALGLTARSLTISAVARTMARSRPIDVVMSTGGRGLRYQLLLHLAREAEGQGLRIDPRIVHGREAVIRQVGEGEIDFAMVQGGFDLSAYPNIRQAGTLHVEPVHLLVKEEIYADVLANLGALRGKTISMGDSSDTAVYWLARAVLTFAGLNHPTDSAPGDYSATAASASSLLPIADRGRLPDALFLMSTPPMANVRQLVTRQRYRLVPIPFGRAFALSALNDDDSAAPPAAPTTSDSGALLKEHICDAVIPAFTYGANPPVPPSDIHTLGTRVLLLTHPRTSPEAVQRVLDAIFRTRFAKLVDPPLSPSILAQLPEAPWHRGTIQYLERDRPLVTGELMGTLANVATVGGPLCGSVFFFWQWLRQRSRNRRERSFEAYILKIAVLERRAVEVEHGSPAGLDELARLHRELGRLKVEALEQFSHGALEGAQMMASFLAHVNDTRVHLNHLIAQSDKAREGAVPAG
jgi:TRAP-type uncharacterized transport system substrate-binding protein